jgi:hypothetical protein
MIGKFAFTAGFIDDVSASGNGQILDRNLAIDTDTLGRIGRVCSKISSIDGRIIQIHGGEFIDLPFV